MRTPIPTASTAFALFFDAPLPWPVFEQAMAVLTALRGPDLLRVKGLVAVEGCRGPVVVHAVQHVAHRPVELEDWPGRRPPLAPRLHHPQPAAKRSSGCLPRPSAIVGTAGVPPA